MKLAWFASKEPNSVIVTTENLSGLDVPATVDYPLVITPFKVSDPELIK